MGQILWRRQWHPTPVLLPGKSHGRRSLIGSSPWSRKESDMTGLSDFTSKKLLPNPTPVLLPGKSHGWRSLVGCSPWGCSESDVTEGLHFHFSLSCIGEGNGNPLQCSCLENPRDRGAWWAAVYGVSQSQTRLKQLSSSSSSSNGLYNECLFFTVQGTRKAKIMAPTYSEAGEGPLSGSYTVCFCFVLMWLKG